MTLHRTSILIAPVVILLLFASTLIGIDRLAFRDVSHFYLPLYDYVADRTGEQWLPLWNPLDQTGVPLLGETTTAVLYPVRRLVFALPLPSDLALSWYVVLHLLLASLTTRWAALRAGASLLAATLAGVIYPLSGGVFFLYTNPPYLVGAAWLPLVLGALLSRERLSLRDRCLIAGPSMAMMILGGDPQTALHAMLVAAAVSMVRGFRSASKEHRKTDFVCLAVVPLLAACLAAPQLAASVSWSSQSDRVHSQDTQPWWRAPQLQSHRNNAYQFSLPPWHAASLLTPNALGRLFPVYQRISAMIPGNGRMWTPTLYLGMLAALAIMTRLARREWDVWICVALGAFLLCMGHFGAVWLLQQVPGLLPNADSAIGGPYWILYQFLPGYDSFRYPVKWLPVFSLAVAISTALWVDTSSWQAIKQPILIAACFITVLWLGAELLLRTVDAGTYADAYWGPLDVIGGRAQLRWSLFHSVLMLLALAICYRFLMHRSRSFLLAVVMVLVAIELGYSNHVWVARVSRHDEQELLDIATPPIPESSRWIRTRSGHGWPQSWRQNSHPDRLLEVAASERLAWFGRWHLKNRQAVINNMASIRSYPLALFWQASNQARQELEQNQQNQFWPLIQDWLGIDGVITVADTARPVLAAELADVRFRATKRRQFDFDTEWTVQPEQHVDSFTQFLVGIAKRSAIPIVHTPSEANAERSQHALKLSMQVTGPGSVQITTNSNGLLSRPVFQDGHWTAEIKSAESGPSTPLRVHRVSFLKQGVVIGPGSWQVRFQYRPFWLPWTLAICLSGWGLWILFLLKLFFRRSPQS